MSFPVCAFSFEIIKMAHLLSSADIEKHIDLSRNTGLHSLTIHIGLRRPGFSRTTTDHAPWALLVAPRSAIMTLTIVLMVDVIEDLDKLDWGHLNKTLETRPQFAGLQRLQFIVYCRPFFVDKMEGEIRERVREQDARGRVDISVLLSSRIFTHGKCVSFNKCLDSPAFA
jgi:hypothetical protein